MTSPDIFVAVPVYRGQELVAETLRSIRNQTYSNFRVLISVDGEDAPSVEACLPFLSDSRFQLVVQSNRKGWPGNLN